MLLKVQSAIKGSDYYFPYMSTAKCRGAHVILQYFIECYWYVRLVPEVIGCSLDGVV